ncbi:GAF domain-containing protein [Deinococcus koreensis]|uniref:histidine kinase n=1 Tax=Deinococcus koreensis TaxID=2054903 RepID=A0A2K3USB5_9DEIO|nr:GAF domain-containing protein [Deinococcus koreensis]PNY79400.1 histidine kinase [Deinococcus koreensis]
MSSSSPAPLSLSEHLQQVTEHLAAARTPRDVFGVVLTPALEALNAVAGAVLLANEAATTLELIVTQGYEEGAQTLWQDGPLTGNVPAGDALNRREGLFFEAQGDLVRAYPELEARTGAVAAVATAVLPMFLDDRPLGTIILDFREPHHFTAEEVRFLRTLAAQCALALGRARLGQTLEARVAARTAELEEQRAALDAFVTYKEAVGGESDVLTLARQAIGVVRTTLAHVSAVYYELDGGYWMARVWSDDLPPEVVAQITAGVPQDAPNFAEAIGLGAPLFVNGWDALANGVPSSSSYGAVALLPLVIRGETRSLFSVGTREARAWSERERALTRAVARGLGVTLERTEHLRALDEERAALSAFARFTEQSTQASDELTLAGLARDVLQATLDVQVGYLELEDGRWVGRVFSEATPGDVTDQARAGVPAGSPTFSRPFEERGVVFVDGWDASGEEAGSGMSGAAALYPYTEDGQPRALLTMGTPKARGWTERERTVFRAVGHSLALAFERLGQTRRVEHQRSELEARTRALEGFAELTRDLMVEDDPYAFVRRAQEVVLSLLPPGYALYYERDGDRWRNRVQTGQVGHEELQAFINAGPLTGVTPSVDTPWTTGEPLYQNAYARGSDTPPQMVQHVGAAASLPVFRRGEVVGVLIAVLFGARPWTPTDRVVLETVVRSLGQALERAEGLAHLAQRTEELRRSNAELEQFAYIASHDLQAPIRAVNSFSEILATRYGAQLDGRGVRYLGFIRESGQHMKQLVDDLLTFSRVATEQRPPSPADSGAVVDQVRRRLMPEVEALGASVTRDELPTVRVDRQQLDQLLQNLIGNALKYHRLGVPPRVQVAAELEGDVWRFTVADNGLGIEPQYFEKIFVIFQRLHGQGAYPGTGIGLAVCKKIVERHGGQLWVESTPGEGSTFLFTLPAG